MRRFARRAATLALAATAVVAVHGCTERLEAGRACPILCPGQNVELEETIVAAIALDSTIPGYPGIGEEPLLLLTSRGDTLETRVIVRYDTLPTTYRPPNSPTDSPIELVEDAQLRIRLHYPISERRLAQTVTVEAYDVDTTATDGEASDTAASTMLPLFRPDRFLGSLTFAPSDNAVAADSTVDIPIDNGYLLSKIQGKTRLRVGLLIRGAESTELVFQGIGAGRLPEINFRVSQDEAVARRSATPYSATPSERFVGAPLADFVIVARRRPPDTPAEVIAVGGVPGKRTYLRFDLPSKIVDSTSVVRATLLLTQYPNRLASNGRDSISLYPSPLGASERITDIAKAATLLFGLRPTFQLDSLRAAPDDSGAVAIEVGGAIQVWRLVTPGDVTRAIVLRLPNEGFGQDELYFFSTEAAAALQPRLRIVYAPRVGFGLP